MIKCECAYCHDPVYKYPSEIEKSKSGRVFCGKPKYCQQKFNAQDEEWLENHKKVMNGLHKTPKWIQNQKAGMQKIVKDPDYILSQAMAIERRNNDPVLHDQWYNNVSNANKLKAKDPTVRANHKSAMEKRKTDPDWKLSCKKGGESRKNNKTWVMNVTNANKLKAQDSEWLRKITEINKKLPQNEEWLRKITESNQNRWNDPIFIENFMKGRERMKNNPTWKENIRLSHQDNQDWMEKITKINQINTSKPDWRNNHAIAMKKLSESLDWQQNHTLAMKKLSTNQDWLNKMRIINQQKVSNPDWAYNHKIITTAMWQTEDFRIKQFEAVLRKQGKGLCYNSVNDYQQRIHMLAFRRSSENLLCRANVYERDNYKDFFNGESGYLNGHHLTELYILWDKHNIKTEEDAIYCQELLEEDNLITVLQKYHLAPKFHKLLKERFNGKKASEFTEEDKKYVRDIIYPQVLKE